MQKPHYFRKSIWYGASMYIPDKIPISWKCKNSMLIWYFFNKCGWLGWFDYQFRRAVGLMQEAHVRWTRYCARVNWEEFMPCQVRANLTYSKCAETGMSVWIPSPFISCFSLLCLLCSTRVRRIRCQSVVDRLVTDIWWTCVSPVTQWWTNLLSEHFDSKPSMESVDQLSLAIRLLFVSPLASGWEWSGVSC